MQEHVRAVMRRLANKDHECHDPFGRFGISLSACQLECSDQNGGIAPWGDGDFVAGRNHHRSDGGRIFSVARGAYLAMGVRIQLRAFLL